MAPVRQERLRALAPRLVVEEHREQDHAGRDDLGDRHKTADHPPVVALALDEAEDHPEQTGRGQAHAGEVDAVAASRPQVRDQQQGEGEGEDADRQVHGEDRAPAEVGDEKAADGRPGDDSEAGDHAVDGEDAAPLVDRKQRHHQGQSLRGEDRRAESLQPPRDDELRRVLREGAEAGGDGEDHDAHGEDVARAVDVAQPRRRDQEDGVEQAVGVQDPQHLVEARVQTVED